MKKLLTTILLAIIVATGCEKEKDTTYFGDVVLTTQSELDEFGHNDYETINGSLQIGIIGAGLEATNILYDKALSSIKRIEGDLIISNTSLHWIEGLKNLDYIGGDFIFSHNYRIKEIEGLTDISHIGGSIRIEWNDNLEKIPVFSIISIKGDLDVSGNAYENMNFLANVKSIGGNFTIYGSLVVNLDGLQKLESVGGNITLIRNCSVRDLNAISNLNSVSGDIEITWNKELTNFCGISKALERFEGYFSCYGNDYNPSIEDILAGNCSME